jgi:hypothetical protein
MNLLETIGAELFGMFVDDGSLALLSLVLIAVVSAAVKLLGLPPLWGGLVLGAGCLVVLSYSVSRAVGKFTKPL